MTGNDSWDIAFSDNAIANSDLFFCDPVAAAKASVTGVATSNTKIENSSSRNIAAVGAESNNSKWHQSVFDGNDGNDEADNVTDNADTNMTVINGRGIWNSWTRNFSTPLLALLDLLDNSFDATSLTNPGRIYVLPDVINTEVDKDEQMDRFSSSSSEERITGLTIWNNSIKPIKPLHKILEVYTSQKGAHAESIGENGVGLKQGCATLSNLSFCIVKSHKTRYSMGVIAYQLQTSKGCSLPAFAFESTNIEDLRREMIHKFTNDYPSVGNCIIQYGSTEGDNGSISPSLKSDILCVGIDRLIEKFQYMNQDGWEQFDHVFGLIIDHLKHGEKKSVSNISNGDNTVSLKNDSSMEQQLRVNKLLETLYQDLPKRYLHIPTTLLDVRVGSEAVSFNYWQPRLVEMAQFDLKIYKSATIEDVFSGKKSAEPDNKGRINDDDDVVVDDNDTNSSDSYILRVYTGFDPLRVCDDKAPSTSALYLHSRQLGRLIKANMDCRGELGLTSGGSEFCQGLTIIVDDYNAHLPLNPTKQDVAFGEQSNGETHKRNLYLNLNAVVRFYYFFYKDHMCNKQKALLSEAIRSVLPEARKLVQQSSASFSTLSECQFSTFGKFASNSLVSSNHTIKLLPITKVEYFLGKDSRLQLPPMSHLNSNNGALKGKKSMKKKTTKSTSHKCDTIFIDDDESEDGTMRKRTKPSKYASKAVSMNNDDNEDDDADDETYNDKKVRRLKKRPRKCAGTNVPTSRSKNNGGSGVASMMDPIPDGSSNVNDVNDVVSMAKKVMLLEYTNRQLNKKIQQTKKASDEIVQQKEEMIGALKDELTRYKNEVVQQKQRIKSMKKEFQNQQKQPAAATSSSEVFILPEDMSISPSFCVGGTTTNGSIYSSPAADVAAKFAKRVKHLKSSMDLLKAENDDLKAQIQGLELTIQRKEKTIQTQRTLIDQRNEEEEQEHEGHNNHEEDDDDDDDVVIIVEPKREDF